MHRSPYLVWLAIVVGVFLLAGQVAAAPLPAAPDDGGPADRPGERPDENDGDADDLMVYMQPVIPDVGVVSSGDDDGGPAGHEGSPGVESKRDWVREILQIWLSWIPHGLIRL